MDEFKLVKRAFDAMMRSKQGKEFVRQAKSASRESNVLPDVFASWIAQEIHKSSLVKKRDKSGRPPDHTPFFHTYVLVEEAKRKLGTKSRKAAIDHLEKPLNGEGSMSIADSVRDIIGPRATFQKRYHDTLKRLRTHPDFKKQVEAYRRKFMRVRK
jgi:hypothetical protein